jgi:hypothetical protein
LELEPSVFFRGLDSDIRAELQTSRQMAKERIKLRTLVKTVRVKKPVSSL